MTRTLASVAAVGAATAACWCMMEVARADQAPAAPAEPVPAATATRPTPAAPATAATPQTVPGSAAPAATKAVTATATATAVVPDAAKTPLAIRVNDPNLKWAPCPPIFPQGCRLAILHGDPSKPGADAFLQVPSRYVIPAHTHTSAERMVVVTGEFEVTYQGQSPVVWQAGQYAYGPAKLPHAATCRSQGPCTLFIAFDSAVDALPYDGKL